MRKLRCSCACGTKIPRSLPAACARTMRFCSPTARRRSEQINSRIEPSAYNIDRGSAFKRRDIVHRRREYALQRLGAVERNMRSDDDVFSFEQYQILEKRSEFLDIVVRR